VTTPALLSGAAQLLDVLGRTTVVDLEQPRFPGMPMFPANAPNYTFMLHRRHEEGLESRTSAAGMFLAADHAGTHVDAFCHQAEHMTMFGGDKVGAHNQGPAGMTVMSAETLPVFVRRGVLIDLAKAHGKRLEPNSLTEADELQEVAAAQGVEVREGDVLLIRTGWGASWREPDYMTGGGMARSAALWAAERKVFAVGADNMSWDLPGYVDTEMGHSLPCHTILLVRSGIYIFENLLLDDLAATGAHEFAFVSSPLKIVGATGSPTRPIALVAPAAS
jgi:kynurenine formamidase